MVCWLCSRQFIVTVAETAHLHESTILSLRVGDLNVRVKDRTVNM